MSVYFYTDEHNNMRLVAAMAARTRVHLVLYEPGLGLVHRTKPATEMRYMRPLPNERRLLQRMAGQGRRFGSTKAARTWLQKIRRAT